MTALPQYCTIYSLTFITTPKGKGRKASISSMSQRVTRKLGEAKGLDWAPRLTDFILGIQSSGQALGCLLKGAVGYLPLEMDP